MRGERILHLIIRNDKLDKSINESFFCEYLGTIFGVRSAIRAKAVLPVILSDHDLSILSLNFQLHFPTLLDPIFKMAAIQMSAEDSGSSSASICLNLMLGILFLYVPINVIQKLVTKTYEIYTYSQSLQVCRSLIISKNVQTSLALDFFVTLGCWQ
jgi:hypothetical protein